MSEKPRTALAPVGRLVRPRTPQVPLTTANTPPLGHLTPDRSFLWNLPRPGPRRGR